MFQKVENLKITKPETAQIRHKKTDNPFHAVRKPEKGKEYRPVGREGRRPPSPLFFSRI